MRYGAPTMGGRVAPRCIYADGILLIAVRNGRVTQQRHLAVPIRTPADLTSVLELNNVDTLITGGVGKNVRNLLLPLGIDVIDNVSQTVENLLRDISIEKRFRGDRRGMRSVSGAKEDCPYLVSDRYGELNCITCIDRPCLSGKSESIPSTESLRSLSRDDRCILEAAMDIAGESPRRLCRLAEVVYFCIEMKYRRIGLAYCSDMEDAASILANVLKRFFEVVPVCCKVGGVKESELLSEAGYWTEGKEATFVCNPLGQAYVLERAGTQFNVVVGLCVGADALFGRETKAPASTLFVKDKSLANNPIGALYSEYYLKESVSQAARRTSTQQNANHLEEK